MGQMGHKGMTGIQVNRSLDSLPNDSILDRSKFKALANGLTNGTEKKKICLRREENILGKSRKCWLPAFSPCPKMFS